MILFCLVWGLLLFDRSRKEMQRMQEIRCLDSGGAAAERCRMFVPLFLHRSILYRRLMMDASQRMIVKLTTKLYPCPATSSRNLISSSFFMRRLRVWISSFVENIQVSGHFICLPFFTTGGSGDSFKLFLHNKLLACGLVSGRREKNLKSFEEIWT